MRRFLCALIPAAFVWFYAGSGESERAEAAYMPQGVVCNNQIVLNQTTSTDLHTFTNTGFICYIFLVSATTQNINLVNGTGTVCATSTAGILGGTTAATGPNLLASEGWSAGNGIGVVAQMTASASHLCLLQSSTGQISGIIRYADQ
jgi:hypothetical protein